MARYDRAMREVIAITGDPGAGKSTLARALARALGASVWSAGDVARALSREVRRGVAWGPEEEMRVLMRRAVEAATGPLILDGWPRRPGQAQALWRRRGTGDHDPGSPGPGRILLRPGTGPGGRVCGAPSAGGGGASPCAPCVGS